MHVLVVVMRRWGRNAKDEDVAHMLMMMLLEKANDGEECVEC